jgi:hypothetical protein
MEIGATNHSAKGVMNGITIIKVLTPVQDTPTLATTKVKEVSSGPSKHQVHVIDIEVSCTTKISFGMLISPEKF